jgi:hypothetical protein
MAIEIEIIGDSSELLKDLNKIGSEMEEINDGTKVLEKSYKETFDKSAKEVDKTTTALTGQIKAQDKLEKSVDDVKKSFVEFDKTKDKAFDDKKVADLNKELDKTDKKVDEIKDSASGGLFDGLTEGVGDLKEGFGEITEGLVSGGPGGVSGALTSIVGKLGPIGAGIGVAVGVAGALGSEIIAINGEFDSLRGKVALLTGETGASLDTIVVSVKAISETFDEDVDESLQAVNVLMKEFSISGQEATALLEKGFLSNANIQGDLIDGVKEYSSQIRASGGSADDLFAILDKSGQEGIFSDKGIDVVKEFGLRIREDADGTGKALENAFGKPFADRIANGVADGTLTSIDALKLVSGELGTLDENSKEAQTVLADVFGGAGEDAGFRFLTQLKDINTEQGFQIDSTNELVSAQQRNLNAQKELADVQNRLSESIGDTSAVGRVWVQIQTQFWELIIDGIGYLEEIIQAFETLSTDPIRGLEELGDAWIKYVLFPLNIIIDTINEVSEALGFGKILDNASGIIQVADLIQEYMLLPINLVIEGLNQVISLFSDFEIPNIDFIPDGFTTKIDNLTKAQKENNLTMAIANSILPESTNLIAEQTEAVNGQLDSLRNSNLTNEERSEILDDINSKYPELLENIDTENITTKQLDEIKQNLKKTIIEEEIARQKLIATTLLGNEIDKKTIELSNAKSESAKKNIQIEIDAIREIGTKRINVLEQEFSDRLGLTKILADGEVKIQEEKDAEIEANGKASANRRKQIESDFQKSVEELLKKGQQAFLNDQIVSEEERLKRNKDSQQEELDGLLDHIKEQNKILNGGKELDAEIIEAFNQAQEQIEVDYQNKLLAIKKKANDEEKKLVLENRKTLLGIDKESQDIRISFLESSEKEELALIEQSIRQQGESERQFEIRKEQDILDTKSFYLDRKVELIDQETQLKLDALDIELLSIADKEGLEYDLKKQNLEAKKELIQQETQQQKEEYQVQQNDFQQQIDDLAGTDKKTLQDSFDNIKESIANALNIDDDQLNAISDAIVQVGKQIFDTISDSLSAELEAQDEIIDKLSERGDQVSEELDREIELNKQGFASNVQIKKEELEQIRREEEIAQKEKEKIVKKQELLNSIQQVSSLVTASTQIFNSLAGIPFVGIPLAVGLIASMFGAFAVTKSKAKNLTKLEKGGSGDSTGMFTGNRHSNGGESFLEQVEVEGGEKWGVLSRSASSKYGTTFDDVVKLMNSGNFEEFGKEVIINKDVPNLIIKNQNSLITEKTSLDSELLANSMGVDLKKLHSIEAILQKQYDKPEILTYKNKNGNQVKETIKPDGSKKKTIIHG